MAQGLHAAFSFPIRLGAEVLGVIEFFSREIRPPDEDLLKMFTTVGAQIGQFMDRRRAEEERAALLAQLEQALQAKDEFLAILGHELRNPLAPLRNAAEILAARAAEDPAIERIQRIIERQVRHMVRLVDDLLDVSRITRGRVELRRERVSVGDVVARAAEAARPLLDERGHELAVAVPAEPVVVDGDPVRLEQVARQPAAQRRALHRRRGATSRSRSWRRAATRSSASPTTAWGSRRRCWSASSSLRPGRAPAQPAGGGPGHRPDPGAQPRGAPRRGAWRRAARGPGQGSEFIVRLPLAAPAPAAGAEDRLPGPEAEAGTPPAGGCCSWTTTWTPRTAWPTILRAAGHEVTVVYDGATALARAAETEFDFVLLDIALPDGLDGYEVARRLRSEGTLRGATLIAVTGFGQDEDRRRAAAAGFDHHLVKPVDPEVVRRLLAEQPSALP